MSNNQLATQSKDLRALVQSPGVLKQLTDALPRYYTPEQFAVCVRTALNKTPKLQDCTPESFLVAVLQAGQMGIMPNGRDGHLIPYGRECQFIPDYKGLVGLVRRNENVSDIYAEVVYENDKFSLTKGLRRDLTHEVDIRADRGAVIGFYAVLIYKDGTTSFEFMSKTEVDAIRKRSKAGGSGPWVTDYNEMGKKTVIKRLLKLADLSPDTSERLSVEAEPIEVATVTDERPRFSKPAVAEEVAAIEDEKEETRPYSLNSAAATETKKEDCGTVVNIDTESDALPGIETPSPIERLESLMKARNYRCVVVLRAFKQMYPETITGTLSELSDIPVECINDALAATDELHDAITAASTK